MDAQLRAPLKPPVHHSTIISRGLRKWKCSFLSVKRLLDRKNHNRTPLALSYSNACAASLVTTATQIQYAKGVTRPGAISRPGTLRRLCFQCCDVRGVSGGPSIGPPWCRETRVSRTAVRFPPSFVFFFAGKKRETNPRNSFLRTLEKLTRVHHLNMFNMRAHWDSYLTTFTHIANSIRNSYSLDSGAKASTWVYPIYADRCVQHLLSERLRLSA